MMSYNVASFLFICVFNELMFHVNHRACACVFSFNLLVHVNHVNQRASASVYVSTSTQKLFNNEHHVSHCAVHVLVHQHSNINWVHDRFHL